MNLLPPINFKNWIEENRHLLKPPVNNKVVYENSDFMIMVVGGPNSRKDYHVDPVEEFFYQVEGDMVLKVMDNHSRVDITVFWNGHSDVDPVLDGEPDMTRQQWIVVVVLLALIVIGNLGGVWWALNW